MLERHQRQRNPGSVRHQGAPDTDAQNYVVRCDGAFAGFHPDNRVILHQQPCCRRIGKGLQLAARDRLINQIPSNFLGSWRDQTRIRIPHGALNLIHLKKRKFLFRFFRCDHLRPGAKGLARPHFAQQFLHTLVVVFAGHFDAADTDVVAAGLKKFSAVVTGITGKPVVSRHVTEVRCMRGRTDIGWNRGLLQPYDVIPARLDEMVNDRCANNTTQTDDNDAGVIG